MSLKFGYFRNSNILQLFKSKQKSIMAVIDSKKLLLETPQMIVNFVQIWLESTDTNN